VSFASSLMCVPAVTALAIVTIADVVGVTRFFARTPAPEMPLPAETDAANASGVEVIEPSDEASTSTEPNVEVTLELAIVAVVEPLIVFAE
jgi:hypothetical protein